MNVLFRLLAAVQEAQPKLVERLQLRSVSATLRDLHLTGHSENGRGLFKAQLSIRFDALKAAGATNVYREKISGARADRPQLAKLMAALKPGDVVMVTKLGRLRAERIVMQHHARVDRLRAAGCGTLDAEHTLMVFESTLRTLEHHRDWLRQHDGRR